MALLKDFYVDELRVRVFTTRNEMGVCAGEEIASCMKGLLAKKELINVMFAAAPSQLDTLHALLRDPDIDWSRVNAFHMDEYVGLADTHPAGFRNFLTRELFGKKEFREIHLINGGANDPQKEAKRYHVLLENHPLDICVLGVGENGHIAFNDPPVADFSDPVYVKIVELEERCRLQQVHDGCFEHIEEVPTHALTVTIPGLIQAKYMFCSVPAATKAEAVWRTVNDAISTDCPATILRRCANAMLYTDADAGAQILM